MTVAAFRRLIASAGDPEALRAQERQEARYRGRVTGLVLGRLLLDVRERTARTYEAAYREGFEAGRQGPS